MTVCVAMREAVVARRGREGGVEDRVGRATTSSIVVVVVTLGGGLEWWQVVEMGGQVRVLARTAIVIGRHHDTSIAEERYVYAEKAGLLCMKRRRRGGFWVDKLEEVST